MALCHALTKRGGIRSEFTITKLGRRAVLRRERRRRRALRQRLPAASGCRRDGSRRAAQRHRRAAAASCVAGPRSRDVLAKLDRHAARQRGVSRGSRAQADRSRPRDRRVCAARQLRRRARLGAALPDRVRAPPVRRALRRRRGVRHRHGRHARDGVAAHREVLPHVGQRPHARLHAVRGRPRPLRAHGARATSSAARRSSASSPPACRTASSRSKCTASPMPIRSATSRCSIARAASSAARPSG